MTNNVELKQIASCFEVSEKIYFEFNKHFKLYKNLVPGQKHYTKILWVQEAVSSYLKTLTSDVLLLKSDKSKYLNVSFDIETELEIERKIAFVRECGGTYTKRMLILEAIDARIQNEQSLIKEIVHSKIPSEVIDA